MSLKDDVLLGVFCFVVVMGIGFFCITVWSLCGCQQREPVGCDLMLRGSGEWIFSIRVHCQAGEWESTRIPIRGYRDMDMSFGSTSIERVVQVPTLP